ncbi:MAG: hypothetical protein ABUS79_10175 [Pseudomonadota bacterium]
MTLTRTIFIALALMLPTTWTVAMAGEEAPTEEAKPAKKGKKAKKAEKAEGEKAPEADKK